MAITGFAVPRKAIWMYNKPFEYYVLLDKDSSVLETSKKKSDKKSKGQKMKSTQDAPPIHGESKGKNYDPFDF